MLLTVCLNADVHLRLGRMRDGIRAEFHVRADETRRQYLEDCAYKCGVRGSLLHDDVSQCIAESMTLISELK